MVTAKEVFFRAALASERRRFCTTLAESAVTSSAAAVLAPTTFLRESPGDAVRYDVELVAQLRECLDAAGGKEIRVYYPLVAKLRLLAAETFRPTLLAPLRQAVEARSIDALWLRVVKFDIPNGGPVNLRRYVEAARAFHSLGVPLVGDRIGTLGVGMLALGALGGVTSGLTSGDRYDPSHLLRKPKGKGFLPPPRVYLAEIGAYMERPRARAFLDHVSVKNWFACQRSCCPSGSADMVADPRRHFVVTRSEEVRELASMPTELRPGHFMDSWLRLAGDRATRAARVDPSLRRHRDRLDDWRVTFSAIIDKDSKARPTIARAPDFRSLQKGA